MKQFSLLFFWIILFSTYSCEEKTANDSNFIDSDSARLQNQFNDSVSKSQAILKTVTDTLPVASNFPPTLYSDSAGYNLHIQGDTFYVHGNYYSDGFCKEISCTNSNNDHSSWRTYYDNGNPRITGFYGSDPFAFQISKWTYYSSTGKVDSIIDMDKKYAVSYSDAERAALKRGWKREEIDIQLQSEKGKKYWHVIHWTPWKNGFHNSEEQLEIDVNTGKEKIVHNYVVTASDAIF